LKDGQKNIDEIRKKLPPWLIVMGIEADSEEKFQIDLDDLKDFGANFQTEYKVDGKDLGEIFLKEFEIPEKLNNFRNYKGSCLHIPFYINLDEILKINNIAEEISKKYQYPIEDLYGYLMPIEQAHTSYYDFTVYYDQNDEAKVEQMKKLYLELSEAIINNGGIIDRPYGPWAKMIFTKNKAYYDFWREIKKIIDPNDIMNPSRLKI
ncbi:MAG: FAD-linked oxidase C-terminal domain-containing protein, partial [Candidatus Hodarchaeota archaeon]